MSTDLQDVKEQIKAFVKEREWEQFHNAKDLALALSIEAAELNECFLWKSHNEAKVDKVKDELADILIYAILFADKYGFDIPEIIVEKIEKNAAKYPADKAKGNAKKYTDL
jgi:NTP pyrophosphatase (non-canonical NTP hydrolase)